MSGWTEQSLRTAASWQAFKEGKALFEGGAVSEAKTTPDGWRGALRAGSRLIRLSVSVKSPTDIEARCPCPENRSTGMLCGHAVAVGLAALAGAAAPRSQPTKLIPPRTVFPVPKVPARGISFPANWRDSLARGQLSAAMTVAADSEPDPADLRLADWLQRQGGGAEPVLHLQLKGVRAAEFLEAAAGHPRVVCPALSETLEITTGRRIPLLETTRQGETLTLLPDSETAPWVDLGSSFWQAGESFIARAGDGEIPEFTRKILGSLAAGKASLIPVGILLAKLDVWQQWIRFPSSGWLESLHFIPAPVEFLLTLDGDLNTLVAQLSASYTGANPVPPGCGMVEGLPRLSSDTCEVRNHAAELQATRRLEAVGFRPTDPATGKWILAGQPAILNFLTRKLPTLRQEWQISEAHRFTSLRKNVIAISPKIEILGSGQDWLRFNLSFQTSDGNKISSEEVRRILRTGSAGSGGRHLVVADDYSQLIEPLFPELDLHQEKGIYEAKGGSMEVIQKIREKIHKSFHLKDEEASILFKKPVGLRAELRPYQQQGAAWLLDRVQRFGGALLADDMGLGKTIQSIALIESLLLMDLEDSGVVLVVATTTLLGNWRAEIGRFAPGRKVRVLHGSGRDAERERVVSGEVVLTSYGTLARDLAWHLRRDYRLVVVDEASLMRNPDTDYAKAICKLRASHRIALTGTPVENGVRDLWSVFRFIQPGWLGGREEFRQHYEVPLASGEAGAAVMERLKLKTQPFLLRRTKEQVAPELPSKLIIDEFCDLSSDQQAVYRGLLEEARKRVDEATDAGNQAAARMRMLTALLRLRQTCNDLALLGSDRFKQLPVPRRSSKTERLLELLEEAVNGGHKILVFSQFQKQLLEIEKCVLERGWGNLRLDGETRNRQRMVDEFQSEGGPPVFLISLKAGGYGLNLTAADIVIHFDPWWNPAAEAQATDRAHRIGQTRPVTVYRLLTRGTVEEKVLRLQAGKRELASFIDEAGTGDAGGWSMKELESVIHDA